jgi:hypothetical protein
MGLLGDKAIDTLRKRLPDGEIQSRHLRGEHNPPRCTRGGGLGRSQGVISARLACRDRDCDHNYDQDQHNHQIISQNSLTIAMVKPRRTRPNPRTIC